MHLYIYESMQLPSYGTILLTKPRLIKFLDNYNILFWGLQNVIVPGAAAINHNLRAMSQCRTKFFEIGESMRGL